MLEIDGAARSTWAMDAVIGVDIGQKRDPTAICVAEPQERRVAGRDEIHFLIRRLERLALGTSYPAAADRVAEIVSRARQRSTLRALYVDATGVGQPIIDLLDSRHLNVLVVATYFNYCDRRTKESQRIVKLGKAFLVSRLQMLLQTGRIHLPHTDETEALARELMEYDIRVDENANDRYGAFSVGTHDDLVTAIGLAVQVDHPGGRPFAWRPGQLVEAPWATTPARLPRR
jgi:Terminase RNaseH-like domain